MEILITGSGIHFLNGAHSLYCDFLPTDCQVVHLLDCTFGVVGAGILDEGETLAFACHGISMDIHIVNGAKRFEKFLQLTFLNLCQFVCKPSHKDFHLSLLGFLGLLDWIDRLDNSHASILSKEYLAAAAARFLSACEC